MRLSKTIGETLRKRVKILIPQMKKLFIILYIIFTIENQSWTKREMTVQPPGQHLERLTKKVTTKKSVNFGSVVSLVFPI